jgi:hypothetical protein
MDTDISTLAHDKTNALRLDTVSLRCMIAASLSSALIANKGVESPLEAIEIYYDVLHELRSRSVYPAARRPA